jgi:hypothetical protein
LICAWLGLASYCSHSRIRAPSIRSSVFTLSLSQKNSAQSVHPGHSNLPFQCGMCVATSSSVNLRVTRSSRSRSKPEVGHTHSHLKTHAGGRLYRHTCVDGVLRSPHKLQLGFSAWYLVACACFTCAFARCVADVLGSVT